MNKIQTGAYVVTDVENLLLFTKCQADRSHRCSGPHFK
jgi:hypothetical protein